MGSEMCIRDRGERVKEELGEDTETTKDSIDTDKEQGTKDNETKELSEETPVEEVKEDEQTTKDKADTEPTTETEKESTENVDTEKATETETTETEPKDLEEESHEDKSVDTIESNESVSTETNDTESDSPVEDVVEKSAKQSNDPVDHKDTKTEDKDNEKRKNKDKEDEDEDDSDSKDKDKDDSKSEKSKKSYIEELAERVLGSLEKSAKRQDVLEKSILDLREKLDKQETESTEKSIANGLSDSPNVETTEKSITSVDQNSDKGYVEKGFSTNSDSTKESETDEKETEKEETGLEFAEKHAEQYQEQMRKAFENGQRNEVSRAQTSWYRLRTGHGNEQDKQVVKSFLK